MSLGPLAGFPASSWELTQFTRSLCASHVHLVPVPRHQPFPSQDLVPTLNLLSLNRLGSGPFSSFRCRLRDVSPASPARPSSEVPFPRQSAMLCGLNCLHVNHPDERSSSPLTIWSLSCFPCTGGRPGWPLHLPLGLCFRGLLSSPQKTKELGQVMRIVPIFLLEVSTLIDLNLPWLLILVKVRAKGCAES